MIRSITIVIVILSFVSLAISQIVEEVAIITDETSLQGETAIAINPLDPNNLIVVWNHLISESEPNFLPGYANSAGYPTNWGPPSYFPPTSEYDGGMDPSVAFDTNGTAYYCFFLSVIDVGVRVAVSRSFDGGVTWETPVYVYNNDPETLLQDKPYITIDKTSGNIYVSWLETASTAIGTAFKILLSYSDDQGISFHEPLLLDEEPGIGGLWVQGSYPVVGPDSDVFVTWTRGTNNHNLPETIRIAKITNGGTNLFSVNDVISYTGVWKTLVGSPIDIRSNMTVCPAIDPTTGTIYVSYTSCVDCDYGNMYDIDINLLRSTDDGVTWTQLQAPTHTTTELQFFGWLSVDELNILYLSYNNSDVDGTNIDVYVTRSIDNGNNFQQHTKVNSQTFNAPARNSRGGYLHYMGMTSYYGFAYPVWTDFRSINGHGHVYFAEVDFPPIAPSNLTVSVVSGNPYLNWNVNGERDINHYNVWVKYTNISNPGYWDLRATTTNTNWTDYNVNTGGGFQPGNKSKMKHKQYAFHSLLD